MNIDKPTVAAFDFDGTISYCDSLIPFLWTYAGTGKTFKNLALCLPQFLRFLNNKSLRQTAKEHLLEKFLKGNDYELTMQAGQGYADGLLNKLVKPEALERIDWHRSKGHTLALISANLDIYLEPWGKRLGFEHVLASELEIDGRNRITGKLKGKNCWGEEKVLKLEKIFGPKENYVLYAYGNSRGDKELLELADYAFYRTFK